MSKATQTLEQSVANMKKFRERIKQMKEEAKRPPWQSSSGKETEQGKEQSD